MFEQALNYLGGLLGYGGQQSAIPNEYYAAGPVAPMPAEMQGPPIPPPPGGVANRPPGPFDRFSPEQRQALGYASLADALGAAAGRPGSAASGLMQTFDITSGRSTRGGLPQIAQQAVPQAPTPMQIQAPPMRPMPQMQAPQIQIGMPPRRGGITNPLFLGG